MKWPKRRECESSQSRDSLGSSGAGPYSMVVNFSMTLISSVSRRSDFLGPGCAPCFDPFQNELQPVLAPLGTHDHPLDVPEHFRITKFLSQFLQKGMNFPEHHEHFAAGGRPQEQLRVQGSLEDKRCGDSPIASRLTQPVVFLRAQIHGDL